MTISWNGRKSCLRQVSSGNFGGMIVELILSFFLYGFFGWCAEVAFAAVRYRRFVNRGFLNGPICPIYGCGVISVVLLLYDYQNELWKLFLLSVFTATLLEWATGVILEKLFHHRWWDYSDIPFNVNGYICPPFSIAWGMACVIVVRYIFPFTLKLIGLMPKLFAMLILITLLTAFAADLYVTVHEIFRLNMKLEKMQEIAEELENVSLHLGENLSRGVLHAVKKKENLRQRAEEKYQEHFRSLSYSNKRLLQAFPAMQSLRHKRQLQMLKEYLEKKHSKKKGEK